ncbi:uncharacterized protein LOC122267626 [Penaeus japonicus]|uniref:uncharacterized protein LOC122267626 n=1 Tax=Penaeus japonicus TaxID=27405 RepID=UPI001C715F5F|nr:uncharacterized protein LOC122267626 [Penaeus japonicus]
MSLRISLWILLAFVAPGLSLSPSTLISQVTLSQLLEEVANLFPTEKQTESPLVCGKISQVPERFLFSACVDEDETGECCKVVASNLCSMETFYSRLCCRSCTLAGQTPLSGPHLDQGVKVPLDVNITVTQESYLRGSNVTISCFATGYPTPEIYWFIDDSEISSLGIYQENVTEYDGILTRTIRNDLVVQNFTKDDGDDFTFKCVAINRAGYESVEKKLRIDNLEISLFPKYPFFVGSQVVTLTCLMKGYETGNATWKLAYSLRTEPYTIVENRWEENGVTVIQSNLTVVTAQLAEIPKTTYVECASTNKKYRAMKQELRIYIIPDVEIPSNCTDVDTYKCFQTLYHYNTNTMMNFCCRTSTLMKHAQNVHSFGSENFLTASVYKSPWSTIILYEGQVKLTCRSSSSYGVQEIKWYRNGEELEPSFRHYIIDTLHLQDFSWYRKNDLVIRAVRVSDIGRYTCRAIYDQVMSEASLTLSFGKYGRVHF